MEWQEYKDSLCSGCALPKHETFADPPPDWPHPRGRWEERYDAAVHTCAACGALQRKAYNLSKRDPDTPPSFGQYFAVSGPNFDDD